MADPDPHRRRLPRNRDGLLLPLGIRHQCQPPRSLLASLWGPRGRLHQRSNEDDVNDRQ